MLNDENIYYSIDFSILAILLCFLKFEYYFFFYKKIIKNKTYKN